MKLKQLAAMSALMMVVCPPTFAADITPDTIFGTGNTNGSFTVTTFNPGGGDIELGLRAKLRFNDSGLPESTYNWDGDDTYYISITDGTPSNRSVFNFEWSINTEDNDTIANLLGSGASALIDYDIDPSASTNFLSYDPFALPAYYGTNATPNGGASETGAPIIGATVAQNSVNYAWVGGTGGPLGPGIYDVRLRAFSNGGQQLGSTAIRINTVPAPSILALMVLGLAGLGFGRYRKQQA